MLLVDVKFLMRDGEDRPFSDVQADKPRRLLLRVMRNGPGTKPWAILRKPDPLPEVVGSPQLLLSPCWVLGLEGDEMIIGGYEAPHGNWSNRQPQKWHCAIVRER